MPVHDWTRVDAGIFHDFHLGWIGEMRRVLNSGQMPPDVYALAEHLTAELDPDALTLRTLSAIRSEIDPYTLKQRTLVIRHVSNHRIVALIEVLSPGNKSNRHVIHALVEKVISAVAHGTHLLLIDLHPPGPRDPQGIHGLLWEHLTGDTHEQPADKPLTLAAYVAGLVKTAYVEPLAVGDVLPDMPLFLDPEQYVYVPLEATYGAAYDAVPRFYRNILENPRP
jgi:hypothetical protein